MKAKPGQRQPISVKVRTAALDLARTLRDLILINARGWYEIVLLIRTRLSALVGRLTLVQIGFVASSFLILALTVAPWLRYSIRLPESESIALSAGYKPLFLLPGLLGLVAFLFDLPRRRQIYYALLIPVAILYIVGIIFPNPIHTSIVHRGDYSLTVWMFAYGGFLLTNGLTAFSALQHPLYQFRKLLGDFLTEPEQGI